MNAEELATKCAQLKEEQRALGQKLAQLKKEKKSGEAEAVAKEMAELRAEAEKQQGEFKTRFPEAYAATQEAEKSQKKKAAEPAGEKKERGASTAAAMPEAADPETSTFGLLPLVRSTHRGTRSWTHVADLAVAGEPVWVRARASAVRKAGRLCFLVLRQQLASVQAVVAESDLTPREMVKFAQSIPRESIVDVLATVVAPAEPVQGCSQRDVELVVRKIFVMNLSEKNLPIQVDDASIPEPRILEQEAKLAQIDEAIAKAEAAGDAAQVAQLGKERDAAKTFVVLSQKQRLDNRVIDLRTAANYGIFRVQSAVGAYFREFLRSRHFTEIHSPKLIGTASEGGAEVFEVKYFDGKAYLAQSPQLYKQMAISGDFDRVFEIGPVFRAENSNTHRHLCEFVGLDMEMAFYEHYFEVLDVLEAMVVHVFDGINASCGPELEAIHAQYPFEPLRYKNRVRITHKEAVAMLNAAGESMGELEDFSTPQEKHLGRLVREKHDTDFYTVCNYPTDVRAFYSMPCADRPEYCNSYDLMVRCEEICSGAQRIHEPALLAERAAAKGIELHSIQPYVDAFRFGAYPHAGGGIGLERLTMLFLGLGNIRRSSLFPRDPSRLTP